MTDKGCAECTDWGDGNCVEGCFAGLRPAEEPPCITDWLCLSGAHLRFGECVEADEPDPFAVGTSVEVHELDGGYLVIPIADDGEATS